jgi:hypothetical protein
MGLVVHAAVVLAAGFLAVSIFVTVQAIVGHRGSFSLAKLFLLVTLVAVFIVLIKIAIGPIG